MKNFLLALAVTLGAAGAAAQQPLPLTIDDAIRTGLENSKTLHSSLMKVDYADARAGEAGAAELPSLAFGGAYTRLSNVPPFVVSLPPPTPMTFTFAPNIVNTYNMRVSVQQPLFTGFRLSAGSAMAENTAEAANQSYARDKSTLVFNIRKSYWNLYKAIEFKKVIDENVEQFKAHVEDVRRLMDQGMATNNDVLKVQVQLSAAQLAQIDAGNNVKIAMIGLDNTIGVPLSTDVTLRTEIESRPRSFPSIDVLLKKAMDQRPDMKATAYQIKAGEAGVTAARSGWYPQIYLTGNYYYARPNQRIVPAQDLFKDTWDVGVAVSLDLWNWGSTLHRTDAAEAQLEQAKDASGLLADAVTLEVTQSYLNLGQAKERISVAQTEVEQAQENYRITDERFKEGLALNTDLLDAEAALLQAKTNLTQVLVDYELAEAQLEMAVGD